MTTSNNLRKTLDWEAARPDWAVFQQFFYTDSGLVRKVKGKVQCLKTVVVAGIRQRVPGTRDVRWDGFGKCWVGTHNQRKRQYDISFTHGTPPVHS